MSDEPQAAEPATPQWQMWLAVFVGVITASNLVLFGVVGKNRPIFDAGKQLGYDIGTGLGLGIGLTLALWLLFLRKQPRKWLVISLLAIWIATTLCMQVLNR